MEKAEFRPEFFHFENNIPFQIAFNILTIKSRDSLIHMHCPN
jgi:hypothetical protein